MIFRAELYPAVLDVSAATGVAKTMTSRPRQDDDTTVTDAAGRVRVVQRAGRTKWVVGFAYSIQPGRGKVSGGQFRLASIEATTFGTITDAEAIREGFATPDDYRAVIVDMYGSQGLTAPCWRLGWRQIRVVGAAAWRAVL